MEEKIRDQIEILQLSRKKNFLSEEKNNESKTWFFWESWEKESFFLN